MSEKSDGVKSVIRRCGHCNIYTLKNECPSCKRATGLALPPRFSPEDRWGKYRRRLKYEKREL